MANFFLNLTNEEIAGQIANLVNRYNRLYIRHTRFTIMAGPAEYFFETFERSVIGCVAIIQENAQWSVIKHLCVEENFRKRGIAERLVKTAIRNCRTQYVYMTIREDNQPNLNLARKLGFTNLKREWSKDHFILAVGRNVNNGAANQNA